MSSLAWQTFAHLIYCFNNKMVKYKLIMLTNDWELAVGGVCGDRIRCVPEAVRGESRQCNACRPEWCRFFHASFTVSLFLSGQDRPVSKVWADSRCRCIGPRFVCCSPLIFGPFGVSGVTGLGPSLWIIKNLTGKKKKNYIAYFNYIVHIICDTLIFCRCVIIW